MSQYPINLVEMPQQLPETTAQVELNDRGLYVIEGLGASLCTQLVQRSTEPHIASYCPNDSVKRFKNIEAIEAWQAKGRLALPLVKETGKGALKLVGLGWMGPQGPSEEEPAIPGAEITFAIRLYEEALGQGNALPYTNAILETHDARYGNTGVWLEAWGDNGPALSTYLKAGFKKVAEVPGARHGKKCSRVYMMLGQAGLIEQGV